MKQRSIASRDLPTTYARQAQRPLRTAAVHSSAARMHRAATSHTDQWPCASRTCTEPGLPDARVPMQRVNGEHRAVIGPAALLLAAPGTDVLKHQRQITRISSGCERHAAPGGPFSA